MTSAMKWFLVFVIMVLTGGAAHAQIIADHTVVDRYADIPQRYIDEVKKMWLVVAGESHSQAYRDGLYLLELAYPAYQVNVTEEGTPEAYTTSHLRASRATWGDINNATGWIYDYGEEDWFTSGEAIAGTKAGISYCNTHSLQISAFGFGWCYDDGTSIPDYVNATQEYMDYCTANSISTKVFFTTGPVDNYTGEDAYINYLRWQEIRDFVNLDPTRILFDYADILCWDDDGTPTTTIWGEYTFPSGTIANTGSYETGHITEAGALRLAKAMWWMLARIAGWDGFPETEWTGAVDDAWENAGNWSNGVPDPSTNVIIHDLPVDPVMSEGVEAECRSLAIDNGVTVTIESGVSSGGSLIVNGTSTGTVVYNRRLPADALYHYISSPVGAAGLPVSALFWRWNEPGGDWGAPVTENSAGAGYTVQANNSLLSFSGPVVTGEVSVPVTSPYADCDFPSVTVDDYSERPYATGRDGTTNYGGGGWNLLGNPYTSAVDATAFIAYNGEAFDQNYRALYIYNGDTYSYIGSELTGWENAEGLFGYSNIQACQGFFVAARCNTGLFVFTPEMQVHNTVVPYTKSGGSEGIWPGIHVRAVSSKGASSTLVVYNEKMSTGLDPGYDLGFMSSGAMIEIYTTFVSGPGGVSYARQALPAAGADTLVLPLGISFAEGGTVTFSAETVECGNLGYWLEDRETGIFTELGQKEYTATLPANTFGTGRFFIVASSGTPTGIKHPEQAGSSLNIWVSDSKLTVSGTVRDGSVCELFDLQGRKLLGQKLSDGGLNRINLPAGLHGVFVVKVTDGMRVTARMVAVP